MLHYTSDRVRDTTSDFVGLSRLQCGLDKDDLWRRHVRKVVVDTHRHATFPWNSGFFFKNCSKASILWLTPYDDPT
jgi:hypothetical protein